MGEATEVAEVQYLVLPDSVNPYLLARVRWPDVAHAISARHPVWQHDQGLFDLPYDPSSATVTFARAASIAAGWGASLAVDPAEPVLSVMRRMPANWSNLVRAEKRAWSLELVAGRRTGRARSFLRTPKSSHDRSTLEPAGGLPRHATPARAEAGSERVTPVSNGTKLPAAVAAERRRHGRVSVMGRAQIKCGQETITVNLVDVGQGGLHCVVPEANTAPAVGGRIESRLLLEDEATESEIDIDLVGRVAWRALDVPGTKLGVEFSDLNKTQVDQLEQFLAVFDKERGS
jgi:hypothetical protein